MKHLTGSSFWACYERLPIEIRNAADKNFQLIKQNLHHPSLHAKKAGKYWSVRIGKKYRALAVEAGADLLWFWIGTYTEYDRLIGR